MNGDPASQVHLSHAVADPHVRLSAALVLSLVLWAPFGVAAARSELEVTDAGVRYLVAFLGCRLAVGGIMHLVASYQVSGALDSIDLTEPPATETRRVDDALS